MTIKNQLFKIKKGLVGAKNVGTFARKNQTNCDELATLEFILPKYKEYNDVFEKPEKSFPLPKHFEDDHEIGLETPEKLATGFIYNINEKKTKTLQVYIEVGKTWDGMGYWISCHPMGWNGILLSLPSH